MKDSELKSVLLGLLTAVEGLEENLLLVSAFVPQPSLADAQDAKNAAKRQALPQFAELRKKIEALPG